MEEVLKSDIGDHLGQGNVFEMLTLDRKIRFFKGALAKCSREHISGYEAGAFMLGRFLSLRYPVAFWKCFSPSEIGLLVNEWVLFEKYMQLLHNVGERKVLLARKQILKGGLDQLSLHPGNVQCLITLKLSGARLEEARDSLPEWSDPQSVRVLELLQQPYRVFYDFNARLVRRPAREDLSGGEPAPAPAGRHLERVDLFRHRAAACLDPVQIITVNGRFHLPQHLGKFHAISRRNQAPERKRERKHRIHAEIRLPLHDLDLLLRGSVGERSCRALTARSSSSSRSSRSMSASVPSAEIFCPRKRGASTSVTLATAFRQPLPPYRLARIQRSASSRFSLAIASAFTLASEAVGFLFLLEDEIIREFPRERAGLDDAVDQVDGLIRPGRSAQRRGSGEFHAVVEHDHDSDRRDARVGRLFVSGNVGDDEIGVELPRDLCALLRHFHQFDDSAVLDQPLRVGSAAAFQAEGANREADVGFHDLVGRFGSVRDHQGEPQLLRHAGSQKSLTQRADLVGLDQGSIDEPLLGASFESWNPWS